MGEKTEYHPGDLVQIVRNGVCTLCYSGGQGKLKVLECPVEEFQVYISPKGRQETLEGKVGLVVYASRNKLQQYLGYRVLIEGQEMFFKSIVAGKYFRLAENPQDEARRSSKI